MTNFGRLVSAHLLHVRGYEELIRKEKTMRRIIYAAVMLVFLGINVACNTVHGLGQDVERAGEKTQDAADSVKRRL